MPIVQAVGVAATKPNMTGEERSRAKKIEEVMSQAVIEAGQQGITDPDQVREMMLAARDRYLAKE